MRLLFVAVAGLVLLLTAGLRGADDGSVKVRVKVLSLVNEGVLCTIWAEHLGEWVKDDEPRVIIGSFAKAKPGDSWEGQVYAAGRFEYEAAGEKRSARAFATDRQVALHRGFPQRPVAKADSIQPPFGRTWGDSPELLEKLLTGAKATVTQREKTRDGELWTVGGLQQGMESTQFRFAEGFLAEVVLTYHRAGWSPENTAHFFETVRGRIQQRYGPPAEHREVNGDSVEEYFWSKAGNGLQLIHRQNGELGKLPGMLQVRYFRDGRERER